MKEPRNGSHNDATTALPQPASLAGDMPGQTQEAEVGLALNETSTDLSAADSSPSLQPPSDPGSWRVADADEQASGDPALTAFIDTLAPSEPVVLDGQELNGGAPALPYPVVAFGASAGGLQALREVLATMPADTGMAFVLITHLSPDHKSYMAEILGKCTSMPVFEIEENLQPEPNHLYVLTPGFDATLAGGRFHLEPRVAGARSHLPIDLFFHSLAADQKHFAIGVVLSGADSDGAVGLKTIKGEGGIALVQSPETAQHSSMPRNSILADHVDLVVSPPEIARELERLAHQFTRPVVRLLEEVETTEPDEPHFARILQMLRSVSGLEFRLYKDQTLRRRIARRMVLLRMENLAEYARYLQARADELRTLQEEVLINVTRFFRDPDLWETLKSTILPSCFYGRPVERPIRLWVAGCSTGEEAYSLAIAVLEYLSANHLDTHVQLFGTDASERSIETARAAIYPDTISADVSPERLRRFFTKVQNGYQISKRVRDICIFARQNLSNDPPFSHIDFLSCRNVMIYFKQTLQRRVISTFHYALEPGGYLLLGMSESLREYEGVFGAVDRKNKIYIKLNSNTTDSLVSPEFYAPIPSPKPPQPEEHFPLRGWPDLDLQRAADRIVLARFSPPGLIIDEHLNILQVRGHTAPYLEVPIGAVSWNLLRLLRSEVAEQIRVPLERAIRDNVPVSIAPVSTRDGSAERQTQVDVLPISSAATRARCFLVLFQTAYPEQQLIPALPPAILSDGESISLSSQLRLDLESTRLHLQSLVEERDIHNQELVSANEEIQSANEELQSSNEELETTKEELQSSNEELQTVNEELQQRNVVLLQTGNDLSNLLTSVNIPLLMLTNDLEIRQFTPPMQRLLNIRPSDVGRSISEIRLQLSIENIEPILLDVLETLGTRELEVTDRDGRWHLLRVRPYRTSENRIEGLVLVLVDIHQLRSSQQELSDARDFASSVVESVPVAVVVINRDCTIRSVNTAFRELTRMPTRELIAHSLPDIVEHLWGMDGFLHKLNEIMAADHTTGVLEFEHISTTSRPITLLIKAQALLSESSQVVLLAMEDITARRAAEQLLVAQQKELQEKIENAARTLDQTQEELRGLTSHLFNAQEEERQHVARELHDDVSQRLSLLELLLEGAQAAPTIAGQVSEIETLREQLQSLNTDVRQISHRLHPAILTDLGLASALRALVDEFGRREGMPVTFVSVNVPDLTPQPATTALYRIAQEALRNVVKHAGRTHVKIRLEGAETSLHLEILDLGQGFDPETEFIREGLGLISMKERARLAGGTFSITSALGRGTTVTVDVPIETHA